MGVMACSRSGCENIMCDRYSSTFGYICRECYAELTAKPMSVDKFMRWAKPRQISKDLESWEAEMDAEFKEVYS